MGGQAGYLFSVISLIWSSGKDKATGMENRPLGAKGLETGGLSYKGSFVEGMWGGVNYILCILIVMVVTQLTEQDHFKK